MNHRDPFRREPTPKPDCAAVCTCCPRCLPWAISAQGSFPSLRPSRRSAATRQHILNWAAIAILLAIPFDSLDGRIARMTNTTSEFGKELDSLADAITFGVAPSLLAMIWGFHFLPDSIDPQLPHRLATCGGIRLFSVSHWRSVAAGAVQHQPRRATAQSGTA